MSNNGSPVVFLGTDGGGLISREENSLGQTGEFDASTFFSKVSSFLSTRSKESFRLSEIHKQVSFDVSTTFSS